MVEHVWHPKHGIIPKWRGWLGGRLRLVYFRHTRCLESRESGGGGGRGAVRRRCSTERAEVGEVGRRERRCSASVGRGGLPRVGRASASRLAKPRALLSASSRDFSCCFAFRAAFRAATCSWCSSFSLRRVSFVAFRSSAFRFASAWVATFCASRRSHASVYVRDVKILDFVKSSRGC